MPDTQKTTKGVREAPTASQAHLHVWGPVKHVKAGDSSKSFGVRACECGALANVSGATAYVPATTEPRYTVELTTEGWQIRDNSAGFKRGGVTGQALLIHVFGSKKGAEDEARHMNR